MAEHDTGSRHNGAEAGVGKASDAAHLESPPRQRLDIHVVHGSLEYASYPVMVGHAEGGTLKGAEEYVDARLDGLLSMRQMIGQYPQRPGEALFLRPKRTVKQGTSDLMLSFPPGAYVLGLGPAGELTRTGVANSVTAALVSRGIEFYEERELTEPASGRAKGSEGDKSSEDILFGVASVLVGAYPIDGLTVEASVVAIVEGILAANEAFERYETARRTSGRRVPRVRVVELEIIERYADRAELAAHALQILPRLLERGSELKELVAWENIVVQVRQGALPAKPPLEEAEQSWRRIMVTLSEAQRKDLRQTPGVQPSTLELDFTVLGRLARADRLPHRVDRRTVDNLVAKAISDSQPDPQTANTLYELLFPIQLKENLTGAGRAQLLVDELTANYPWEVMTARVIGEGREVALSRLGLLRQFREMEGQRFAPRRAANLSVLVIGNPPVLADEYPGQTGTFPSLRGAAREAREVAELLSSKKEYQVKKLIWDESRAYTGDQLPDTSNAGRAVLNALFAAGGHRIVHVAAHGEVADESSESGALIGGGMYLTANVVRQLPIVPEVVFLNCCHLARVGFNRLAAGIARELMAIGVQVVVAAGWPINDDAAVAFAKAFYDALMVGRDFGDAVGKARTAAWNADKNSLTWGAYQCYGDPGFRLNIRRDEEDAYQRYGDPDFRLNIRRGEGSEPGSTPRSAREVIQRIQAVAVRAGDAGRVDFGDLQVWKANLLKDLHDLESSGLPNGARWSDERFLDARLCYELGHAYAELGELDQAVYWYRLGRATGPMHPLVLLEQLANLEIRLAQHRYDGHMPPPGGWMVPDEIPALILSAEEHLDEAMRVYSNATGTGRPAAPTSSMLRGMAERYRICGSLAKKKATMEVGERKRKLIHEAADHYHEAHVLEQESGRIDPDPYSTLLWLQLASLESQTVENSTADELISKIEKNVHQKTDAGSKIQDKTTTASFWEMARHGDIALTRLMRARRGTRAEIEALGAAYERAFGLRSSWKERNSVLEHLRDLQKLIGAGAPSERDQGRARRQSERLPRQVALASVLERLGRWEESPVDASPVAMTAPTDGLDQAAPAPTAESVLNVELVPAAYGDCLLVQYGIPGDLHRILIDGGPNYSYAQGLRARLDQLHETERDFELLVVTHIDSDHIDGGVIAMQDKKMVRFKDIWFNGWKHLEPIRRGALQGAMLDALIPSEAWNKAFGGKAVVVPDSGELPVLLLPGGARVTLLSPGQSQLSKLRDGWRKVLAEKGIEPEDATAALKLLEERIDLQPPKRGKRAFGDDNAPANGSSIAFLLEYAGRSVLLSGDAHAPVLLASLQRLARAQGRRKVKVDAFKLPHHGSKSNVSEELFQAIDCMRFLISTNGAKFNHPDSDTIELIGRVYGKGTTKPKVFFNYRCETTKRWEEPNAQREANVVAEYPREDQRLVLDL